ncbi:pancreatic triacylglycerol lipase-like [Phymastichus coffea]|uniref:pancreatic triacylglycerol lipase-like n=1 Tax=Phymastichus coffea TaxID=108790 RepID=UPI00273B71B5|nr:pancreatic triacylglycerol lipase-like [Phymastichus coffea]
MRASLVLVIASLFHRRESLARGESQRVTCSDIGHNPAGWLAKHFSSDTTKAFDLKFYISTNWKKEPVQIDTNDWSQLASSGFDTSSKTFIIIHGYFSGGQQPWVLELKNVLLDRTYGNVIMVDWSGGSNKKNYVNAAKNTIVTSNHILNFLQRLQCQIQYLKRSPGKMLFNHLHLIGHSLGAHVCGQTGHLLKNDNFWKVDRITGLDPAKPCFTNVEINLRIDKENADFVDIIHTQIGRGFTHALGLNDAVGHIDFYMNGGYLQPECQGKTFGYNEMICSHRLATKYFIESVRYGENCTFPAQRWDGTYTDAQVLISFFKKGWDCNSCPKLGLDAVNSSIQGVFLVLTGTHQPYCRFNADIDLQNIIPGITKLRECRSIFDCKKNVKLSYLPSVFPL